MRIFFSTVLRLIGVPGLFFKIFIWSLPEALAIFLLLGAIFKTTFFCDRRRLLQFFSGSIFSKTIFSVPAGGPCDFFLDLVKHFLVPPEALPNFLPDLGNLCLVLPEALPKCFKIWEIFISFRWRRCQNSSRFEEYLFRSARGAAKIVPDSWNLYLVLPEVLPKFFQAPEIFILFCWRCCQKFCLI